MPDRFRDVRGALAAALLCLVAASASPRDAEAQDSKAGVVEPLVITTRTGPHRFEVEVMRTDADRSRGLMFRRSMAPEHGMLFDFAAVAPVAMWMKNTYLPLDMVFIRANGTIVRVAADTEPLSTKVIPSGEPVLSVLELNAGTAARLGIRSGDTVEHPLFQQR
ncbi:DUF192 domain-containing protein [Methylobacterium sp. BTF04]|nr:DUF192 domain-containing protein [Methylobacterium sp. BTF04]